MTKMKPQLACDCEDDKLSGEYAILNKIDGVRMLHIIGSATGRSLKPHANKYVTEKYSHPNYTGLDGEVTFGDITSESLCRDTTSVLNRISGEPNVVWNVFDYRTRETEHLSYVERYRKLTEVVEALGDDSVKVIPYVIASDKEEIDILYEQALENGYEGIVGRKVGGKTKNGRATAKESTYWRKKPSSDKEAKVVMLVEAQENLNEKRVNALGHSERSSHKENKVGKGMVGMLQCIDCTSGSVIDVGAGKMTHEERTFFWNNPDEIIGKFIKYRSLDVGVKDAPRHARFLSIRAESDMS